MNWTDYLRKWAGFSKKQVERDCLDMYESWTDTNDWIQIKNDFYRDQLQNNEISPIFLNHSQEAIREYLTNVIHKIDLMSNFTDCELLVLNSTYRLINENIQFGFCNPSFWSQTRLSKDETAIYCQQHYNYPYRYSLWTYFKPKSFNHIQWEEKCKKIATQVKNLLDKDLNVEVKIIECQNNRKERKNYKNLNHKEQYFVFGISIYDGPMNRFNPRRGLSIFGRPRRKRYYHYYAYDKTY